jgi:hypothetical protein
MTYPVVGSVPRGDDFFGRQGLIENLWIRLERDNVLLVAPRRFGKTGVMYQLLDNPNASFRPLYINVEHILTAGDFMVELMAALLKDRHFARIGKAIWAETKEFGQFLRNLPSSVDFGGVKVELREKTDVPSEWISYGERLMPLLSMETPQILLLIDEFAVMIDHIAKRDRDEAVQLLHWFRRVRISADNRTRFVIGGSINLVSTLNDMGLVDTVNDLSVERLKPFDTQTAEQYVESVFSSKGLALPLAVKAHILELVGEPIPYLLAVLLTAIFDRHRATREEISLAMVTNAFDNDLLGGATAVTFNHYRTRIDEYYPGREGQAAKAILGILSRSDGPVRGDTLYQVFLTARKLQAGERSYELFLHLMTKLDNDFYIETREGTYSFFSRVLKLWWKTHYGFQGER